MSNHGKRKSAFEDADNGRSAQTADGKRVKISVQIWGLRVLPGMTCPVLFERAFRLVQQAEGCKVVSDRRWARLVIFEKDDNYEFPLDPMTEEWGYIVGQGPQIEIFLFGGVGAI